MSAGTDLFQSREFREADLYMQIAAMGDAYPQFRNLPSESQSSLIARGLKEYDGEDDILAAMQRGFMKSIGDQAYFAANAIDIVPGDIGEGSVESLRQFTRDMYEEYETPKNRSSTEAFAEVVGGLPVGIAAGIASITLAGRALKAAGVGAHMVEMLAPSLGIGIQSAIGASDQGFIQSMEAGLEGAAFGAMFPALQHLPRPVRALALGSATYGLADEKEPLDVRLSHALTMAGMAGWSKSRIAIDPILKMQGKPTRGQMKIEIQAKDDGFLREAVDEVLSDKAELEASYRANQYQGRQARSGRDAPDQFGGEFDASMRRTPIEYEAPARGGSQTEGGRSGERTATRGPDDRLGGKKKDAQHPEVVLDDTDYLIPGAKGPLGGRNDIRGRLHSTGREIEVSTEPPKGGVPKKHQKIFANLFKAFGISADYGSIKQPRDTKKEGSFPGLFTAGHESPMKGLTGDAFSQRLQIQHHGANSVGTNAHEFGHNLSFFSEIGKAMHQDPAIIEAYYSMGSPKTNVQSLPAWLREMHHLSYDAKKPEEGFAELVKHWLTNRSYLAKEAPNALAKFESAMKLLPKPQQKAMEAARKGLDEYYKQSGRTIGEAGIGPAEDPSQQLHTLADERLVSWVDGFHGVTNMVRRLGIEDANNVSEAFYRLKATSEIGEMMLENGAPVLEKDKKGRHQYKFTLGASPGKAMAIAGAVRVNSNGRRIGVKEAQREFLLYATGVQAAELKRQAFGKKGEVIHLTTDADLKFYDRHNLTREKLLPQATIDSFLKLETPGYKKAAEVLMKYQKDVANFGLAMGLYSKDQMNMWQRRMYMFSFHREMQANMRGLGGKSDKLASMMGVERQFGSSKQLREPLQNLIDGPARLVRAAFENRARTELADVGNVARSHAYLVPEGVRTIPDALFLGQDPSGVAGAGKFLSSINARHEKITTPRSQLTKFLETEIRELYPDIKSKKELDDAIEWLGLMPERIEELSIFLGASKPLAKNIMTILRDGKKEYYQVHDSLLIRALENINQPLRGKALETWGRFKAFKTMMIVAEPGFILANLSRDFVSANVMTRTGHQHLTAAINGMYQTVFQTSTYKDFMINGGAGSTFRKGHLKHQKRMEQHAKRNRLNPSAIIPMFSPMGLVRFMNQIGKSVENWNRVGEYARGVKKGMGKRHSAFLGREISTDFSRKGDSQGLIGFANQTIPFFSAMIAGTHRMYRANFRDPNGRAETAVKLGLVSVMSAGMFSLNEYLAGAYGHLEDENGKQMVDWKGLPSWARAAYWHSYVPTEFDPDTGEPTKFRHFMLPKPWEIGMLGTWAELTMQGGLNDPDDYNRNLWMEAGGLILANFGVNLPGHGASGSPIPIALPAGLDILAEQWANKVAFTGSDIETPGMEGLLPRDRARSSQTQTMQKIGRVTGDTLGFGAARGEALLRGLYGHWATMGLQFMDQTFFFNQGPRMDIDDYPGIRRFFASPEKYTKYPSTFYDNLRTAAQIRASMNRYESEGDWESLEALLDDPVMAAKAGVSPMLARASATLQEMHREQRGLKDGTIEPYATQGERFNMVETIEAERLSLMKYINDVHREVTEEG